MGFFGLEPHHIKWICSFWPKTKKKSTLLYHSERFWLPTYLMLTFVDIWTSTYLLSMLTFETLPLHTNMHLILLGSSGRESFLSLNPISHEVGPLWPTQLESVHHFHRSWTIDTKIHDFVSFHIFQLPVMPFLTFFQNIWKIKGLNIWGGLEHLLKIEKILFLFNFFEGNVDFSD